MPKVRGVGGLKRLYEAASRDGREKVRQFYAELEESLEKGEIQPNEFSVREVFEGFVEDGREIVDSWKPGSVNGGINLIEAGNAIDTSAFSNITGQIVYTRVIQAFGDPAFIGDQLVETIPTQFNGEKIPGIGRLGDASQTIPESGLYPTVGTSEEWIDTPQTTKRGFIVPVTKEAIFFDRTGLVLERAREVAEWCALNKEKRILDIALGITTSYRRNGAAAIATYQASTPFVNIKSSNGLTDWTNVEAAELLFDALTDPNTGEVINIVPDTLIVPTALKHTARRITRATEVQYNAGGYAASGNVQRTVSANPLDSYNILTSRLVKARTSSATTWFIGNPKKAFAYMQNWPISVVQAPNNSEPEFTQDIVARYKVSERGAAAVRDPRYMVKCTA
jgi:hypothetical protein